MDISQQMPGEVSSNQTAAQRLGGSTQPVVQQQQPNVPPVMPNSSLDISTRSQPVPPLVVTQDASINAMQHQNTIQGPASSQQQQKQQTPLHLQQPQLNAAAPDGPTVDATAAITKKSVLATQPSLTESEADTEEIRKLEQEFEKKMLRAKKSYGTRMDNLHRSKVEAEAHHQMTLQKHEKERIEFEKRVRLAEEEQAKRLNQIQKEFNERKKEVRQQRTAEMQNGDSSSRPPLHSGVLHGGHKRSSSHFDSSMSMKQQSQPSAATDHKRNSSDIPVGVGGADINATTSSSQQALLDGGSGPQRQQKHLNQPPPTAAAPHRTAGQQPPPAPSNRHHNHNLPPNLPKPVRSGQQQVAGNNNSGANTIRDRSGSTSS